MKYLLEINPEQAHIIVKSLELYSRALIGQVHEAASIYCDSQISNPKFQPNQDDIRTGQHIVAIALGFPGTNGSHGIHNPEVSDEARQAYDIEQVVRSQIAKDENFPKYHIWNDKPYPISNLEMSKISKKAD